MRGEKFLTPVYLEWSDNHAQACEPRRMPRGRACGAGYRTQGKAAGGGRKSLGWTARGGWHVSPRASVANHPARWLS